MLNPMKVIRELDFVRLSGTAGEKEAVEIICRYLQELGYTPEIEKFSLNSFEPGAAAIEIDDHTFAATPYGLNENVAISGELVWLDNIDMIKLNRGGYKDKIVMSYGFSRGIATLLKEYEVAGYINVGGPFRKATSLSHRQSSFESGYTHSVTVDHDTAIKLKKYSNKTVKLKIKQTVMKSKGHNIIVDIPGAGLDNTLTLAGGHLDSVAHSPGASDNGGGIVTLLKIAEYYSKHKLQRDLRLVFFGGEELGLLGSQNYVKDHLEELKARLGLMLNIDVSGDAIGVDAVAVIGTDFLLGYVDGLIKETGYMFQRKLDIYSSDCMPFSVYEFPSVNLARFGGKASRYIHTDGDNYKNVTKEGYESCIRVAIHLLDRIINAGVYPVDREIDSSLREKIEKYIWNLTYEEPKLEWTKNYKK
ncbi:MAG: M20/M25/M40 family metallo-hydrolase [Candidatus Cloacimonetes bacterium]|nr:M20/M25/M40 family metallo-hydrolase [Candidatus Cloacimonadota bacterium]